MESNASSFSPGRMDQYIYPYYQKDIQEGKLSKQEALEILECLWLKFNQIVYLRNQHSAKYFAGFPIGFNIAIGGQDKDGNDTYKTIAYCTTLSGTLKFIPQQVIRDNDDISVVIDKLTQIEREIKAIDEYVKGNENYKERYEELKEYISKNYESEGV